MELTAESPRRRSSASSSPEFEFWMLRNPPSSNPDPPLLSADELFSDGILLPLHILSLAPPPPPIPLSSTAPPPPAAPPPPPSRKWKHIFKSGEKKKPSQDRKPSSAPEININIWPFSRSRSSGTGRHRSAPISSARRISSAPCSRCNSHGESAKHSTGGLGFSPARSGRIYLGRSNPVWQIRRRGGAGGRRDNGGSGVGRVINLNVNTCIGHQRTTSCRDCDEECEAVSGDRNRGPGGGDGGAGGGADGEGNGGLFKLKAVFTRKVY